jgi:hypothetical protein
MTRVRIRRILGGLDVLGRVKRVSPRQLKSLPSQDDMPQARDFSADIDGILGRS